MLYELYLKYIRRDYFEWHKKHFGYLGAGARISSPVLQISHPENISIGENSQILSYARIQTYPELMEKPGRIVIGKGCFLCYFLTILGGADVTIGDGVLMASHVLICSESHGVDPTSELPYMSQPLKCAPITIGDGTWIGEKACILSGVSIGKKCIIGAGAIVTKSIPDYSMAVGNPARVIKKFDFEKNEWVKVE